MSSSSLTLAKLYGGVCQGSLVKAIEVGPGSTVSSGFLRSSSTVVKIPEYCVLVGVRLTCYESWLSMNHGHAPTAIYAIVGASSDPGSTEAAFRVVTNQGTHLWFASPSNRCRDIWLKALNCGLERYFTSTTTSRQSLSPIKPRYRTEDMENPPRHCSACGRLERYEVPLVNEVYPVSQYGLETRQPLTPNCAAAQGLVEHILWIHELFIASRQEQEALTQAREAVLKALIPDLKPDDISSTEPTTRVELSTTSHEDLKAALSSPECIAYARSSPTLDLLRKEFDEGLVGCMELVELLEQSIGIKDKALAKLKQQAFRFNGDMGTALKMLVLHALPNPLHEEEEDHTVDQKSTQLLQCILEFFFDLVEEGELQSIAFFWPQLLHIHLQMLPATNIVSLRRVELMEDFLLTVATQHSIQLALELIWSHTADLEDAKALPHCARRKNAVLRFLCELESLLFDFEMGWGGGAVTVGQFLAPSSSQFQVMRNEMRAIQSYRLMQPERLSRSRREQKLLRHKEKCEKGEVLSESPSKLAQEALRVAKNADYLSTHLSFTKRLGDVAFRLFHQSVERRVPILEAELAKLNSSGTMGGDLFNRIKQSNDLTRVVRIPAKESHVFRSKERTPVLLLVETIDEGDEIENAKEESLTPFPTRQPMDSEESVSEHRTAPADQMEQEHSKLSTMEESVDASVDRESEGGQDTTVCETSDAYEAHKVFTEEAVVATEVLPDHDFQVGDDTRGKETETENGDSLEKRIEASIPLDPELRGSEDWLLDDTAPRRKSVKETDVCFQGSIL